MRSATAEHLPSTLKNQPQAQDGTDRTKRQSTIAHASKRQMCLIVVLRFYFYAHVLHVGVEKAARRLHRKNATFVSF